MKFPSEEDKEITAYKQLKVDRSGWINTFVKHQYMFKM